ncbi:hypothetical protein MMPV_009965 [Pyropia vietnamensis]
MPTGGGGRASWPPRGFSHRVEAGGCGSGGSSSRSSGSGGSCGTTAPASRPRPVVLVSGAPLTTAAAVVEKKTPAAVVGRATPSVGGTDEDASVGDVDAQEFAAGTLAAMTDGDSTDYSDAERVALRDDGGGWEYEDDCSDGEVEVVAEAEPVMTRRVSSPPPPPSSWPSLTLPRPPLPRSSPLLMLQPRSQARPPAAATVAPSATTVPIVAVPTHAPVPVQALVDAPVAVRVPLPARAPAGPSVLPRAGVSTDKTVALPPATATRPSVGDTLGRRVASAGATAAPTITIAVAMPRRMAGVPPRRLLSP